ncbi:MAG: CvpA family protein [Paludibacteraceae bacterium]|nr:CvpA family protein [Paludibacteraceae bacterium]
MTGIDIILSILLLIGFVRGAMKGLIMELSSLVGFTISVYVAKYYSGISLYLLEALGVGKEISPIFSFLITFLLCMVAVWFLAKLLSKFCNIIALGWLNKLLGGLFSLLKYGLILSVLINLFDLANKRLELVNKGETPDSKLYTPLRSLAPTILPYINMEDITGQLKGVLNKDSATKETASVN